MATNPHDDRHQDNEHGTLSPQGRSTYRRIVIGVIVAIIVALMVLVIVLTSTN